MPIVTWAVPLPFGATLRVLADTTELDARLGEMAQRMGDPDPLWVKVGDTMRRSFARNFAVGGRPAWAPLRPATVRAKAGAGLPARTKKGNVPTRLQQNGRFGPQNILIATGELRDSYAQKSAKGHVERAEDNGEAFFIGSQLTRQRQTATPLRITVRRGKLTRKAAARRGGGRLVALARVHHLGNPAGNLPARPVAVLQAEDETEIARAAANWLQGVR